MGVTCSEVFPGVLNNPSQNRLCTQSFLGRAGGCRNRGVGSEDSWGLHITLGVEWGLVVRAQGSGRLASRVCIQLWSSGRSGMGLSPAAL